MIEPKCENQGAYVRPWTLSIVPSRTPDPRSAGINMNQHEMVERTRPKNETPTNGTVHCNALSTKNIYVGAFTFRKQVLSSNQSLSILSFLTQPRKTNTNSDSLHTRGHFKSTTFNSLHSQHLIRYDANRNRIGEWSSEPTKN